MLPRPSTTTNNRTLQYTRLVALNADQPCWYVLNEEKSFLDASRNNLLQRYRLAPTRVSLTGEHWQGSPDDGYCRVEPQE